MGATMIPLPMTPPPSYDEGTSPAKLGRKRFDRRKDYQ
jgi:hypothetical protein